MKKFLLAVPSAFLFSFAVPALAADAPTGQPCCQGCTCEHCEKGCAKDCDCECAKGETCETCKAHKDGEACDCGHSH